MLQRLLSNLILTSITAYVPKNHYIFVGIGLYSTVLNILTFLHNFVYGIVCMCVLAIVYNEDFPAAGK